MKSVITKKYQAHIPAAVRKAVGLTPDAQVSVRAEGTRVVIEPVHDSVLELGGTFAVSAPIVAEHIRTHVTYSEGK